MQADFFLSMLGALSSEAINDIAKLPLEAQCIFTLEPNCEDYDEFIKSQVNYIFQIRGDFLTECEEKTKKIIGGISLNLDYKFEIKRFTYYSNNQLKTPYAFLLYFPEKEEEEDQVIIKLGVTMEYRSSLEHFASCLQSKAIFQLDIFNNYKVIERIWCSNSSALYSAIRLRDNKEVVIKCVKKEHYQQINCDLKKGIQRQYDIPRKLESPYICKYYGIFENDTSFYIVMEKLQINFLQYMHINDYKEPQRFKQIFHKICLAINVLHQQGIMHRDIKPQNILLRKINQQMYEPVLIDFGLAQYDGKLPYIFVRCGTPGYVAPEIVSCTSKSPQYNRSCDVFSLGSLFHLILLRKPLFEASYFKELLKKNKDCQINFENEKCFNLGKAAKDLLSKMLEKDPKKRITIKQILAHQYFEKKNDKIEPIGTNEVTQTQILYRDELQL